MAYAASVGSNRARRKVSAVGFIEPKPGLPPSNAHVAKTLATKDWESVFQRPQFELGRFGLVTPVPGLAIDDAAAWCVLAIVLASFGAGSGGGGRGGGGQVQRAGLGIHCAGQHEVGVACERRTGLAGDGMERSISASVSMSARQMTRGQ